MLIEIEILEMLSNAQNDNSNETSFWTTLSKDRYTLDEVENSISLMKIATNDSVIIKVSEDDILPNDYILFVEWGE